MKRILVTSRLVIDPAYNEVRDALDVRWGQLLGEAGLLPVSIPSSIDPCRAVAHLDVEGIILTGGNDLVEICDSPINRLREDRERALLKHACERRIPTLGVCRGMQLIASFFGGKIAKTDSHVATRHSVSVTSRDTSFDLGPTNRTVNSFHNYGVIDPGAECTPCAVSGDEYIEAFRHRNLPCFGVMWHPERESPFDSRDLRMIGRVFGVG